MQVTEKWLTLLNHVGAGFSWQWLLDGSRCRRWVPWICDQYQAAYITASNDADC